MKKKLKKKKISQYIFYFQGLVVYADPPTACQDIKGPPNSSEYDGNNWIVLIARLNCTFEVKIRNAQRAGYSAAIVHNVNSNELGKISYILLTCFYAYI